MRNLDDFGLSRLDVGKSWGRLRPQSWAISAELAPTSAKPGVGQRGWPTLARCWPRWSDVGYRKASCIGQGLQTAMQQSRQPRAHERMLLRNDFKVESRLSAAAPSLAPPTFASRMCPQALRLSLRRCPRGATAERRHHLALNAPRASGDGAGRPWSCSHFPTTSGATSRSARAWDNAPGDWKATMAKAARVTADPAQWQHRASGTPSAS